MITSLVPLWHCQGVAGWSLPPGKLRQELLLVTRYGGAVSWAAGLQRGWLWGERCDWSRGTAGAECLLVAQGTATARSVTHLRLQHAVRRLLGGARLCHHSPWHFLDAGDACSRLLKSEVAVAGAGATLVRGGGGEVVQLGAGAGRGRQQGAALLAGREAAHLARPRLGGQQQLLAVVGLGERAQALAHRSAGRRGLVVIRGLGFDAGNWGGGSAERLR